MNSTYFTPQQLEDLAYCLLLSLLDPRAIMVYDLICNVLAAVISSMQQRGLYHFLKLISFFRKFINLIERVCSIKAIPSEACLGLLLLRIPLVNPVLQWFRSVLSFYILNRLS